MTHGRFAILSAATTALLAGCALPVISESEVESAYAQVFEEQKQTQPISTDARLTTYVNCVAMAVIDQAPEPYRDREWEIVVFDSPQVNAFAMAGEKIGVYTGILEKLENQDQLASVLGHEVAHVTERHPLERVRRNMTTRTAAVVAGAAVGGGVGYSMADLAAELGITRPFTRGEESEADDVGLRYMAEAGFDPRQSIAFWRNSMKEKGGREPAQFLSTHPSDETRVTELVKRLPEALQISNAAHAAGRQPTCQR